MKILVLAGGAATGTVRVGWRTVNSYGADPFDVFNGSIESAHLEGLIAQARASVMPEELQVLDLRERSDEVRDEAYYSELARIVF